MGDDALSILGQILFTAKKQNGRLELKKVSPINADKCQSDFEDDLSEQAKADIALNCSLALSGKDGTGSFHTNLYGRPYIITLITQYENTFVFLAAEEPTDKMHMPETSAFYKLCSIAQSGIFFWRVKNRDFFLSYANASYFLQTGLSGKCLYKRPEDIYKPKRAVLVRSQLDKCVSCKKIVTFNNKVNKRTLAVTLYPEVSDGEIVRIMGVSTDITEQVSETNGPEQSRTQSSKCETMLQDRIRFEEILFSSAKEFLDAGLSGFDECLERMIQKLGSVFDADWVFACKSNTAFCGISSQWLNGAENGYDRLHSIIESTGFGAWITQLRAGRIFVVNDILKEMPSLYAALKCAGSPDVRSFIAVPVVRSDEFWGVLCVSSFCQKRIWTTREIGVLKTASDIIISAYLRTKMEKQLGESNRVLVEYDECLQDMLSVEESLSAITAQFLDTEPKEFGQCASDMLYTLSELTDADHACIIMLNDASPKRFYWHKKGLSFPFWDQDKFAQIFSGWKNFINSATPIAMDDVSRDMNSLPPAVQDYALSMGLKSLLIIPILSEDTLTGMLFLAKVLGSYRWDNTIIHTAKRFAGVFRNAYLKMCRQQQLLSEAGSEANMAKEALVQAQLIKTTAECAQQLIDATAENLPAVFSVFCRSIAEQLPINSVNLTQYIKDYTKTFIVLNWRATGPNPKSASNQSLGRESIVLSIPVFYREIVWGCLLVNLASPSPADGFMRAFEMVAECFVRAYMRIHEDNKDCIEGNKRTAISLSPSPFAI